MNNLKQYKKHFGKEFDGSDASTYRFYDSRAVTKMFQKINKLEQENKRLKEENEHFITKLSECVVKIDKSIEYIEHHYATTERTGMMFHECENVIEILKGDNNE